MLLPRQGFVRYRNRADAEQAKQEMHRKTIGTRQVRIGWGDNNLQKHCVHVQFNASQGAHLTEDDFRVVFEKFAPVLSVSLPRYTNRRLKGYGFVHFEDTPEGEQAALNAISGLTGATVGDGVSIRCSYGKRQNLAKRRMNPRFMNHMGPRGIPTGPTGGPSGPGVFPPAWIMQIGPNGNWQPVQFGQVAGARASTPAQAFMPTSPSMTGQIRPYLC